MPDTKPKKLVTNRIEKFEVGIIRRDQVHNAPYNPRKISADAAKKIRKGLRDFGMLAPITWNKQTGNIVGGHQRIVAMDAVLRKTDYELTVAIVDLEPEQEVKANVVLNNPAVMGEWDQEKLAELKMDFPELDFETDLGFDKFDLDLIFAGTEIGGDVLYEEQQPIVEELDKAREVDRLRQVKKDIRAKAKADNERGGGYNPTKDDYMVTFVFPTNQEKQAFMKRIGKPVEERYVKHGILYEIRAGTLWPEEPENRL